MIDITQLTASAWTMIQPYLPILATKAAEQVGGKVPEAVGKVWDSIRKKFESKPAAKEALEDVEKTPDDPDTQASFRQQLKKALNEDESFASALSKLLEAAGDSYKATLTGDGAIAQGTRAKSVGKGGVMIDGNVSGSNIITDNRNSINTDEKKKK